MQWPGGLGAEASAARLRELGLARGWALAAYLWLFGDADDFLPGEHLVAVDASPGEVARQLARSPRRARATVTIPEGWNHLQIGARLEERGVCVAAAFRVAVRDPALRTELQLGPEGAEGWLFPATYDLHVNTAPQDVVRRMVAETRARLAQVAARHPGALERLRAQRGLDLGAVVTLASIVEKEARLAEERPVIASVYLNRLSDPTFRPLATLGADPTAGYGCLVEPERAPSCAGYAGRVTPAVVRDPANRWNTYRHPGLPPGPIANPGEASLEAVLAPAATDYLFFVHVGGGRHAFSRTLEEHEARTRP
ncbi:MAG: endolytic transglycosylase MltG [Polyangiaceae bacterium]|nr:endolytic transglycosylase MltG [Polyangiaceae bacterium]